MIGIAILFIVLGVLIKYGKLYFLIAGYNTLPKEDKEKIDIDGVATVFRNVMFGMALIIFLGILASKWFENKSIEDYAFYASFMIGLPYLLIKSNSDAYKIDKK